MAIEREAKLAAWPGFVVPDLDGVLPGLSLRPLPSLRLTATYYDTPDLRLARWGITVRYRSEEALEGNRVVKHAGEGISSPWTVKFPDDKDRTTLVRREHSFRGAETRMPPGLVHLLRAHLRRAAVTPVARLRTDRYRFELVEPDGTRVAELDDDIVSVLGSTVNGRVQGRRVAARFREIEVEVGGVRAADSRVLDAVVHRLLGAGAEASDPTPKVVRALGPRASEPPEVVIPELSSHATIGDVVRSAIAVAVTRLLAHDPGVRLGEDPEDVHQARVATRRLRSDLHTFRDALDRDWLAALRGELGWIAGHLGAVRDADVLLDRLRRNVGLLEPEDANAGAAVLRRLHGERDASRIALLEVMDSDRYVALVERLVEAAAHPVWAGKGRLLATDAPGSPPVTSAASMEILETATANGSEQAVRYQAEATSAAALVAWVRAAAPVVVSEMTGLSRDAAERSATERNGKSHVEGDEDIDPPADDRGPGSEARPDDRGAPPEGLGARRATEVAPDLVRSPWRALEKAVDALGDPPSDDDLHAVRILAKRCRYAAEAVAPVVGRPARRFAEAVAGVQGILGDFHDAVVAEQWLRASVHRGATAQALVVGQLIGLERIEAQRCRDEWGEAWTEASAKKRREWFAKK